MSRPSGVSFTCPEYFSVASLYALGHSIRFGSAMVIGHPCLMHHSIPGEIRSLTLSMFWSVIRSPGVTSAAATPPSWITIRTAAHADRRRMVTSLCRRAETPLAYTPCAAIVNGCSAAHRLRFVDHRPLPGPQGLEDQILVVADVAADQDDVGAPHPLRVDGRPSGVDPAHAQRDRLARTR